MAVKVLFLSRFDSARGQMAEGFLRELESAPVEVHSAGSTAFGIDPRAVLVTERLEERIGSAPFAYLITVCERDESGCPVFPGKGARDYWPIADPARAEGGDGERMAGFRNVRDQIEARVRNWLETHRRELASGADSSVAHRPVRQESAAPRDALVGSGRRSAS